MSFIIHIITSMLGAAIGMSIVGYLAIRSGKVRIEISRIGDEKEEHEDGV